MSRASSARVTLLLDYKSRTNQGDGFDSVRQHSLYRAIYTKSTSRGVTTHVCACACVDLVRIRVHVTWLAVIPPTYAHRELSLHENKLQTHFPPHIARYRGQAEARFVILSISTILQVFHSNSQHVYVCLTITPSEEIRPDKYTKCR